MHLRRRSQTLVKFQGTCLHSLYKVEVECATIGVAHSTRSWVCFCRLHKRSVCHVARQTFKLQFLPKLPELKEAKHFEASRTTAGCSQVGGGGVRREVRSEDKQSTRKHCVDLYFSFNSSVIAFHLGWVGGGAGIRLESVKYVLRHNLHPRRNRKITRIIFSRPSPCLECSCVTESFFEWKD